MCYYIQITDTERNDHEDYFCEDGYDGIEYEVEKEVVEGLDGFYKAAKYFLLVNLSSIAALGAYLVVS